MGDHFRRNVVFLDDDSPVIRRDSVLFGIGSSVLLAPLRQTFYLGEANAPRVCHVARSRSQMRRVQRIHVDRLICGSRKTPHRPLALLAALHG